MAMHTFESLRAEYRRLWDSAAVTKTAEAGRQAQLINKQRATYEDVAKAVGAPWWAIAVLHLREAGEVDVGRWRCVLHNGEKIIGTGRKTQLKPEGRGPFTSFKAAAIDAFEIEGLRDRREWTECPIEFLAFVSEKFNGFGYRDFRHMVSPYLWGGTTVQQRGKYVADGKFDANVMDAQIGTMAVLKSLQQLDSTIGAAAGQAIAAQETAPTPATTHPPVMSDLAHLVVAAMERKGYQVDRGPGELNIVYVEGMNADGTPNNDEANKWNDLRLLIEFEHGQPRIVGKWAATTEPGRYWTENPLSQLGAARIEFGQYKSWQVGWHHPNKPSRHEALVQTGGKVTVCRDLNKDGVRTGDRRETGNFGINQHWGYDLAEVDKASAGCLVGQSKDGHRQFMALVKSDPRYQTNRKCVFATAILPEADVLAGGSPTVAQPADQMEGVPPVALDVSDDVRRWQKLLGFSEEEQDGIFGAITEEAVKRFQRRHGLTITGDVEGKTRDMLEDEAFAGSSTIVKPPERAAPIEPSGENIMNPLIAIAGSLLPEILKLVTGDKGAAVADAVQKAVSQTTGASDPAVAQKKIEEDPKVAADLRAKLAQIAADEEEKKRQAQIDTLKAHLADQDKQRQADLERFKATLQTDLQNTASARSTFATLAQSGSQFAWGAPAVSVIVSLGFFVILGILLLTNVQTGTTSGKLQVINVIIGTLATAFATVVNFWLGSSLGSRNKDNASFQAQAQQAKQTSDALKAQSDTALKITEVTAQKPAGLAKPSKAGNFDRCLEVVLAQEGGFTMDSQDPGGATNLGITIGELKRWRHADVSVDDVKNLTKDEAREIYRTNYWNVMKCDQLPAGVDLTVFDFGVNAGTSRSVKMLQEIIAVKEDGSVGPTTIAAAEVPDPKEIIHTMAQRRLDYYRGLSTWDHFGRGWTNRTYAVEKASIEMVG